MISRWLERWWPVASVVGGIGIATLLGRLPGGQMTYRLVPLAGVAIIAVACYRDLARRDRPAFVSIFGPALVVALVSVVIPARWLAFVGMIPILFLALFVFTKPMGRWWWRHVLRRPPPTLAQRFDYRLGLEVQAWSEALERASPEAAISEAAAAKARAALVRLRDLVPPDADWEAIRDGYLDVGERWILLARGEILPEDGFALQDRLDTLRARRIELRGGA
jgi:hypothetical protein